MQWLSPKALEESERGGASTRDMECALIFASKMKIFHAVGYRCLVYEIRHLRATEDRSRSDLGYVVFIAQ